MGRDGQVRLRTVLVRDSEVAEEIRLVGARERVPETESVSSLALKNDMEDIDR